MFSPFKITSRNMDNVVGDLIKDAEAVEKVLVPTFRDIAIDWHGKAKNATPVSPTKTQYLSTLKHPEKSKRTMFNRGDLERSISWKSGQGAGNVFAEVYSASNTGSKEYAYRIHSERGKKWQHLGAGSVAKGTARDKFIEDPRDENLDQYEQFIRNRIDKHFEAE